MADQRTASDEEAWNEVHGSLRRGDIAGFTGVPGRSKRGELSLCTPCSCDLMWFVAVDEYCSCGSAW